MSGPSPSVPLGRLILVGCTVLLAACGGSSAPAAPTVAAAQAAAAAINLTSADVPGYTGTPHQTTAQEDTLDSGFALCLGANEPKTSHVAQVSSEDFAGGSRVQSKQVSSTVSVSASRAQAQHDLAADRGSRATGCLQTYVQEILSEQQLTSVGSPTVSPVTVAADGSDGAFGYEVTLTITSGPARYPLDIVFEGAVRNNTGVVLHVSAIGRPFPVAERESLFATLLRRLGAAAV